jgi:hypothetical protein
MNHMMSIARSAGQVCARYIAQLLLTLKELASTLQINSYTQPVDNLVQNIKLRLRHAHVIHMLDMAGMLSCKSPSRAHRKPLRRIACGVAIALVGALCLPTEASNGDIKQHKDVMQLADLQLTEKQEYCHDLIAFKESSNNRLAVNGSHYGYYQGRSKALKGAPDDYQFYWYWSYVSHRYGITQYDEPNYCKALHHLRVKGWQ